MTLYVHYDPDTNIFAGFYDDEIHNTIPQPSLEITREQHSQIYTALCNNVDSVLGGVTIKHVAPVPLPVTWDNIRVKRDALLAKCDYTQISDWTGDKQAWATYRQQLRDIPQQFSNPEDVVWPTPPGV